MDYYRASVTSQSWEFLVALHRAYRVVVIGGWAVWLYTHQMKSKDIDIVVELSDIGKLRNAFDVVKNDRLKKYELRRGEAQVDIYAPFYSHVGVPAEDILRDTTTVEGFRVPSLELLVVLKIVVWNARRGSAKGRKDFLDLISLLQGDKVDYGRVCNLCTRYSLADAKDCFMDELRRTTAIKELSLNPHTFSRAKQAWLDMLKN